MNIRNESSSEGGELLDRIIALSDDREQAGEIAPLRGGYPHLPPYKVGGVVVKPLYTNEMVVLSPDEVAVSYGHGRCIFCGIKYVDPSTIERARIDHIFGAEVYAPLGIIGRLRREGNTVGGAVVISKSHSSLQDIRNECDTRGIPDIKTYLVDTRPFKDRELFRVWVRFSCQGELEWKLTTNNPRNRQIAFERY